MNGICQLLDIMDYIGNSFMMLLISLLTALFVGWGIKPQRITDEVELGDALFKKKVYSVMIRYVISIIMAVLFFKSTGVSTLFSRILLYKVPGGQQRRHPIAEFGLAHLMMEHRHAHQQPHAAKGGGKAH